MATTVPGAQQDPEILSSFFSLELENGIQGEFTEITGLGYDANVVSLDQSDKKGNVVQTRTPGIITYNPIVAKRYLTDDKSFFKWMQAIRGGKLERTNGSVVLYGYDLAEVGRWTFENAWISKWSASDLDVGSDDAMVEEVTLTIGLLKREK